MTQDQIALRALAALATLRAMGYTVPVTSKKGVAGSSSLKQSCSESRSSVRSPCGFDVFASSFGGSDGEPARARRFPQGLPGLLPVRATAPVAAGGVVVANRNPWRPFMAHSIPTTASGHIAVVDGQPSTTTQDIADVYGKRHDDVLRIVRQRINEAGEWGVRNFTDTPHTNPQNGQTYTVIRMTKKGFHFVVGKFTGAKAVAHQIAFADEFERMEAELQARALRAQSPDRITPAQAQHLRELVQLVVDSGKQGHGETWNRLHRKMKVNSYLQLHPSQFDAACQYLRGKFDDTTVAALIHKHLPDALQALPAPTAPTAPQALDVPTLCQLILGGVFTGQDFLRLAYAVNQQQYLQAARNPHQGYGQEVAEKLHELSWSDLHTINQRASLEVWMRTAQQAGGIAA